MLDPLTAHRRPPMPDDDPKHQPFQVNRFDRPNLAWTPPAMPILPDARKRRSLHEKIGIARAKAVSEEVVYLLDEFTKTLQALNLLNKGVTDIPDRHVTDNTENVTPVTEINSETDPPQKQATP